MWGTPNGSPVSVVVPLPPSYRGGTEEYAYRLARLYARTYPVSVLTTTVRWQPDAPILDTGGAAVERLPAREMFERPVLFAPGPRAHLWRTIRRSRVLQLHMPFPLVEAPATKLARRAGVPSVLTYHMDANLAGARRGPGSVVLTELYRRLSAHPALDACDVVISNSREYAEASPVLSRHLGKVRVIRKGVDRARLGFDRGRRGRPARPSSVPADLVPRGRSRLLFIGRLVPYKGVAVLLEAVRQLVHDGRDVGLLIAGRGPLESELRRRAAELDVADRTGFLGFVPDAEVGDLYRYADVVVAPSINSLESTATALEEAAMCGTPVVGTTLPGTSETVPHDGRRGLLVAPGDPDALARAVGRMIDAGRPSSPIPLRTWDDTAREYLQVFDELGAGRPSEFGPVPVDGRRPSGARPASPLPTIVHWVRGHIGPGASHGHGRSRGRVGG
ncbi:MAG: glycosyltransferase [Thermoplasmata archaeon]|nr:glycosyltransferase [Thermoplasmata archaeon]